MWFVKRIFGFFVMKKKSGWFFILGFQERYSEPKSLAFWMANASELLHFLKCDRHISAFSLDAQDILAESVQIAFRWAFFPIFFFDGSRSLWNRSNVRYLLFFCSAEIWLRAIKVNWLQPCRISYRKETMLRTRFCSSYHRPWLFCEGVASTRLLPYNYFRSCFISLKWWRLTKLSLRPLSLR